MAQTNSGDVIYYAVPVLPAEVFAPAVISGAYYDKLASTLTFVISRDISVKLHSFKVAYRFSSLPISVRDPSNQFTVITCCGEEINRLEIITKTGRASRSQISAGFSIFIPEVTLETGEVYTYDPTDYIDISEVSSRDDEDYLSEDGSGGSKGGRSRSLKVTLIATGVVAVLAIGGMIAFPILRSGAIAETADMLIEQNRYNEAYKIVSNAGFDDTLQRVCESAVEYYLGEQDFEKAYVYAMAAPETFEGGVIRELIDSLVSQGRYDEARHFLASSDRDSVDYQQICETASGRYLEQNNFQGAYFYSEAAPQPFTEQIIEAAESILVGIGAADVTELDENAFTVVKNIEDDARFDALVGELCGKFRSKSLYSITMRLAKEYRDEERLNSVTLDILLEGMQYYVGENDFASVVDLIKAYGTGSDGGQSVAQAVAQRTDVSAMVSHFVNMDNSGSAIILANFFGIDSSSITVKAEDASIRENLASVYSLLTPQQKRAYHSDRFSVYKEAYLISGGNSVSGGSLSGTSVKDAVSVASAEYHTVVLHADGTVSSVENSVAEYLHNALKVDNPHGISLTLPSDSDIVQIAVGRHHVVMLHDNGRVTVSGSGEYGQNQTADWTDIVAVAAGADFTLGLRSNGDVVACGSNDSGQCEVSLYHNVVDIAACDQSAVMLFADGSVMIQGDVSMRLLEAESFTDVVKIRAGKSCIVAQRADGSFLMADGTVSGSSDAVSSEKGVSSWKNVTLFDAGSVCVGYVGEDGKINLIGDGAPGV